MFAFIYICILLVSIKIGLGFTEGRIEGVMILCHCLACGSLIVTSIM